MSFSTLSSRERPKRDFYRNAETYRNRNFSAETEIAETETTPKLLLYMLLVLNKKGNLIFRKTNKNPKKLWVLKKMVENLAFLVKMGNIFWDIATKFKFFFEHLKKNFGMPKQCRNSVFTETPKLAETPILPKFSAETEISVVP